MNNDLEQLKSLNTIGTISYVLHLVVAVAGVIPGAQVGVTLLLVALIIDLIKRGDASGTWHESHFNWRLRTLLIAGVLYLVTLPLWLLFMFPGMVAWWGISIWFLYRIIKGMIRMNAGQSMES